MPEQPSSPTVSADELRRLLDDGGLWLVYAPDRATFADGHIPGSLAALAATGLVALVDRSRVVVYGEDGQALAARELTRHLARAGVDAWWLDGGLTGWVDAGYAVEGRLGRADHQR